MVKRRSGKRNQDTRETKRIRVTDEETSEVTELHEVEESGSFDIHIESKDRVERKVDVIVKDVEDNCYRSLTIHGNGLGIEKTVAVVEELKRNFMRQGTKYTQETSIKTGDNKESHLQVILTIDKK